MHAPETVNNTQHAARSTETMGGREAIELVVEIEIEIKIDGYISTTFFDLSRPVIGTRCKM